MDITIPEEMLPTEGGGEEGREGGREGGFETYVYVECFSLEVHTRRNVFVCV